MNFPSSERLAPIFMTALAAGLALVPIAPRMGEAGNEIQSAHGYRNPLWIAVFDGPEHGRGTVPICAVRQIDIRDLDGFRTIMEARHIWCFCFQRQGVATDEGPRHNQTESKILEKEFAMFIVVEHTITNPDTFFELAPKVSEAPLGIKALQFFPSTSKDRAVCLWEAESVETLKRFLEPMSAQSSRNVYYAVDTTKATGLPTPAAAAVA